MNYPSVFNPPILIKRISFRLNLKFFWVLCFILTAFLFTLYLFQINSFISQSYILQDSQKKIAKLSEDNRILEIEFAKRNYLENIEPKIEEFGFEKIGKINYLQISEKSLAANK